MAPIGKNRLNRRIDRIPARRIAVSTGAGEGSGVTAPPVPPTVPTPTGLNLTSALSYNVGMGGARIDATWTNLETFESESYALQLATDAGFATVIGTYTTPPNQASASVDGLPLNTTYYGRVRAIVGASASAWSATASVTTPAADTVAPAVPTGVAASFINAGDLAITWTNPTSPNFRAVEIKVYASNGGALLFGPYLSSAGIFVWTAAQNLAATAQVGDPSLYVELRSVNWYAAYSAIVSASATKAVPANVTGLTHSWVGDAGAAAADCNIQWTAATDASSWRLTIDGSLVYPLAVNYFNYTLDRNTFDHGTPDPSLALSIVAVDGLKQVSATPTTTTATNAAPAAPTATLTQGAVSGLYATVTSTPPADFWRYEFVFKRDGVTVATVYSSGANQRYEMQGAGDDGFHSWTVVIRQEDVFAQFSATVTPSAVAFEALTLSGLRADVVYSDNLGTAAATLKAALADNVTTSGGISYPP